MPWLLRPLARFRARDHLGAPGSTIRANVDAYLARRGIDLAGGRVLMLASAATLGRAFNPLSLFWCYAADGRLAAVLAEVHNTYRGRHVYLLRPDAAGRAGAAKSFYVSPFLPLAGQYRMRLPEPGRQLRLSMTLDIDGRPALIATVRGVRREYSRAALLRCLLRYPGGRRAGEPADPVAGAAAVGPPPAGVPPPGRPGAGGDPVTAAAQRQHPRALAVASTETGAAETGAAGTSGPRVPAAPAGRAGRARAAAARLLVTRMAARLPIRIEFPDGSAAGAGGPAAPAMRLRDPDAFFARLGGGHGRLRRELHGRASGTAPTWPACSR